MRIIRFVFLIAVVLAILFLTACAGGGGGSNSGGNRGGNQPPPAPTASILASAASIIQGDSVILNWTSTNAISCQASGNWSGDKALSGSEVVTPQAIGLHTFRLDCQNSTASVSSSTAVQVNPPPPPVAPTITVQPASQAVTAGQTATFTVVASGTSPLVHQWWKNGAAIGGATAASYTTPSTTMADNGAQFSVIVSNAVGSVTSSPAALTVTEPAPLLTSTTPTVVVPGHVGEWTLTVFGANFVSGSTVLVNGGSRATTFVNPTELPANKP